MSAGEFPNSEFQDHDDLIAELRAGTLDAPEHLHRRVLAGGSVKRRRWSEMSGRKRAFGVVALAAVLATGAAVVHAALSNPNQRSIAGLSLAPVARGPVHGKATGAVGATGAKGATGASGATGAEGLIPRRAATGPVGAPGPTGATGPAGLQGTNAQDGSNLQFDAAQSAAGEKTMHSVVGAPAATGNIYIPKNRLVHASAYLSVVVPNHSALTTATNKATAIATGLGGYAQSVRYSASNSGSGSAYLDLHVPLGKTEEAIARLGTLGRLVSQQVSTQDLEQQFTQQTNQIGKLRREIAVYEQALASGTLSGQQRVNVQLKLANAQHELAATRKARVHTVKSGSTASIQLSLMTKRHAAVVTGPHKRGRLSQMLHNAVGFLAVEAFVVFYAIIVALPLILLGALIWWFTRGRRQRDEKRLLASA